MNIGVIGGSLAGLEFTREMKRLDSETEVTVFEEDDEIGGPVKCAEGWLTIHSAGEPFPEAVENEVDRVRLRFEGARPEHRDMALNVANAAYVVDRSTNEQMLAEECVASGASVVTGQRRSIEDLRKEFDLVVDASGCPPQHWREYGRPKREWSQGVQYLVRGDLSNFEDEMYLEFHDDLIGYYWIFPKSDEEANVGIGWSLDTKPDDPWKALEKFTERHVESPELVRRTAGMIGTEIETPMYWPDRNLVAIGDAAGLADPANGEGMTSAVISARILADAVDSNDLSSYEEKVMETLGPQLENSLLLREIWEKVSFQDFAKMFNLMDGFDIEDFFENPDRIKQRLMRNPSVSAKLLKVLAGNRLKSLLR